MSDSILFISIIIFTLIFMIYTFIYTWEQTKNK